MIQDIFNIENISDTQVKDVSQAVQSILSPNSFKLSFWMNIGKQLFDNLIIFGVRLILSVIIFFIFRWIITQIMKLFQLTLKKRNADGIVFTLLDSIIRAILYIFLFILMATIIGVKSVSFAAVLASLGLAVGMALSGQLQNLAGGVIILFTKPFGINDHIKAEGDGVEGVVKSVTLFHTQICTFDNKMIFIPNSKLSSGVVINFAHNDTRRCEWIIGIEYNENFERVRDILLGLLSKDERVLKEPTPTCVLSSLGSSSVNVMLRCWTSSDQVWPLYWDINKQIYAKFNQEGIGFPFPQLTVHQQK